VKLEDDEEEREKTEAVAAAALLLKNDDAIPETSSIPSEKKTSARTKTLW